MFSFLYGLWNEIDKHSRYSILFLGIEDAGKTTLLNQLMIKFHVPSLFSDKKLVLAPVQTTVGQNSKIISSKSIDFHMLDIGGNKNIRTLWASYLVEGIDLVFYLVDGTNHSKLQESAESLSHIIHLLVEKNVLLFIVINKMDAGSVYMGLDLIRNVFNSLVFNKNADAVSETSIPEIKEKPAPPLPASASAPPYFEVSAKTGIGVMELLSHAAFILEEGAKKRKHVPKK